MPPPPPRLIFQHRWRGRERELGFNESLPHSQTSVSTFWIEDRGFPNGQLQNHAVSTHKSAFSSFNMNFPPDITASKPIHIRFNGPIGLNWCQMITPTDVDCFLFIPLEPTPHFLTSLDKVLASLPSSLIYISFLSPCLLPLQRMVNFANTKNAHHLISFLFAGKWLSSGFSWRAFSPWSQL